MNKYYLNMIEQMGYSIYRDEFPPHVYMKNSVDLLKRNVNVGISSNTFFYYENEENTSAKISINDENEISLFVSPEMKLRLKTDNKPETIYNVAFETPHGKDLNVSVTQNLPVVNNELEHFNYYASSVFFVNYSSKEKWDCRILIYCDRVIIEYLDGTTKEISIDKFSAKQIVEEIVSVISNINFVNKGDKITDNELKEEYLKGLKIIVPSLKLCANDMLRYVKKYLLPNAIIVKKQQVISEMQKRAKKVEEFEKELAHCDCIIDGINNKVQLFESLNEKINGRKK